MSGPKSASYTLDTATVLLALFSEVQLEASRQASQRERQVRAQQLQRQQQLELEQERRDAEARSALRRRSKAAHQRLENLIADAEKLGDRFPGERTNTKFPTPSAIPETDRLDLLEDYERELNLRVEEIESALRHETKRLEANENFRSATAALLDANSDEPRSAAEVVEASANRRAALTEESRDREVAQRRRAHVEKLSESIAEIPSSFVPSDFHRLLDEYLSTPSDWRAAALEIELSARASALRRELDSHEAEASEAEDLLASLPVGSPADFDQSELAVLRKRLLRVVTGEERLTHATRHAAQQLTKRALSQAAGAILQGALEDLGYETEEIDRTLFVEGGFVHFQRETWGDHYVRLRVAPERDEVNFNMVRVGGEPSPRDKEREEDWCSEVGMPQLAETLSSRGFGLTLFRTLSPGEVAVEEIEASAISESLRNRGQRPAQARRPQVRSKERNDA